MFEDLKTIFNVNEKENDNDNENDNVNENENENDNVNENENENDNDNENKGDDGQYYKIKQINSIFKMIYETKSFKDQINIFKKYQT